MPFLAARIGPGQLVPRASTIFSAWMVLRSSDMVVSFCSLMDFVLVRSFASNDGGLRLLGHFLVASPLGSL